MIHAIGRNSDSIQIVQIENGFLVYFPQNYGPMGFVEQEEMNSSLKSDALKLKTEILKTFGYTKPKELIFPFIPGIVHFDTLEEATQFIALFK